MRRRSDDALETPIASLIDVVFLLIIFFVVTIELDRQVFNENIILAFSPHAVEISSPFYSLGSKISQRQKNP